MSEGAGCEASLERVAAAQSPDGGVAERTTRLWWRNRAPGLACAVAVVFALASPSAALAVGDWSNPTLVDSPFSAAAVSCTSASFCVAVDANGDATTFDGTSWSALTAIDSHPGGLSSVSCSSATFCVAVDVDGNAQTYNGTSWSTPTSVDGTSNIASVSCASASFCVAVDASGNAVTFNGSSWSAPVLIDAGGVSSVSCPSTSFCMAVDGGGESFNLQRDLVERCYHGRHRRALEFGVVRVGFVLCRGRLRRERRDL